jgi:hypothetical protein
VIGVIVNDRENDALDEFFQLFKTPWKFWQPGEHFDAVLATRYEPELFSSLMPPFLILCGSNRYPIDDRLGIIVKDRIRGCTITLGKNRLPIYTDFAVFDTEADIHPFLESDCGIVGAVADHGNTRIFRIGFNLLEEMEYLLTVGQPPKSALRLALDLHIDLVRILLLNSGVDLLEIPPIPFGYRLTCCLTHDIDFFGIRRQGFDRTTAGFLYRATMGSLIDYSRGRRNWPQLWRNWISALSLPLVYSGLLPDFWKPLKDYRTIESDLPSTFYLVPFANHGGISPTGKSSPHRAVAYQLDEVASEIRECAEQGSEIGVHGLDAWNESQAGYIEKQKIARIIGRDDLGIRMHWLYFDPASPQRLEQAGFDYDSTVGYNDAVGFRAGTAQVYKFLNASNLLELPLVIQDTALFYPARMNLTELKAFELCLSLADAVSTHGGVLTINWHCRSLAPERLWIVPYLRLLKMLKESQTWFATASQAVMWYRQRRCLKFKSDNIRQPCISSAHHEWLPKARLRQWRARHCLPVSRFLENSVQSDFVDIPISFGDAALCDPPHNLEGITN